MAVTIDGVGEINGVVLPTTSFGKVLQVVRATDTTNRSTTSTSFVDITGMSVTITPQKSTSVILVIANFTYGVNTTSGVNQYGRVQITDSSNNAISGAEESIIGLNNITYTNPGSSYGVMNQIAYATPATTSAVTYKLRVRSHTANISVDVFNAFSTGQMYAIEVSA
jgi:hypothetical protein